MAALLASGQEADWPCWRGPTRDGIAPASAQPPVEWGADKNVLWSVDVPGRGHASPVIIGEDVFIAAFDAGVQSLRCLARADGATRWETPLHRGTPVPINKKNSHASLTPAWDGARLYTLFAIDEALHLSAVDRSGKIAWQTNLGPYKSEHGPGASPLMHDAHVIVSGEDLTGGYLAAFARADGKVAWKTPRARGEKHGNYANPNLGTVAGRAQLVQHGFDRVTAYDPATGKELWHCDGPTEVCANMPLFDDKSVYISGGYPGKQLMCIRADGTGDVTKTHLSWSDTKAVSYVPSSILHKGRLYVVSDDGIATCYDAADGKVAWRERLEGAFTASIVMAAGRLYLTNETGTTTVLAAADTFRKLAENKLPGATLATPAVSGDRLLIRTDAKLFCVKAP